ncbi:MAG: NAD(P)/FAD-dependent oxidoreductase [Tissierellia bacterium]|nr:NAD(P)/FAD-dependent oxidoreductase [Tissierellia bacterium]
MDRTEYLILGCGIAGYNAAKTIREYYPDRMITVISRNESLNKYIERLTKKEYDAFLQRDEWLGSTNWYYENNVELRLSTNVTRIDTENRIVGLEGGSGIQYSQLLIATGSRVVLPSIQIENYDNAFMLKTLEDLIGLDLSAMDRIAILGGTYLGVTQAMELRRMGKSVLLLERGQSILHPFINATAAKIIAEDLEKMGIQIMTGLTLQAMHGDGNVQELAFEDGRVMPIDGLILNKGIKPNIEFLFGSEIEYDIGIKVDENLKTNVDGVYAAGDCVEFDKRLVGQWEASLKQGVAAAKNMIYQPTSYRYPDEISIMPIGDKKLFAFGDTSGAEGEELFRDSDGFKQLFWKRDGESNREGHLMGIVIYGDISSKDKYVDEIIENRRRIK